MSSHLHCSHIIFHLFIMLRTEFVFFFFPLYVCLKRWLEKNYIVNNTTLMFNNYAQCQSSATDTIRIIDSLFYFFNHSCTWHVVCHLWGWCGATSRTSWGTIRRNSLDVVVAVLGRTKLQSWEIIYIIIYLFIFIRFCCLKGLILDLP